VPRAQGGEETHGWSGQNRGALIVVLFVLWLIELVVHVAGGPMHLLLVLAGILILGDLVTGRSTV
jgi:hypothetical protein